jgi:hypothetical protein
MMDLFSFTGRRRRLNKSDSGVGASDESVRDRVLLATEPARRDTRELAEIPREVGLVRVSGAVRQTRERLVPARSHPEAQGSLEACDACEQFGADAHLGTETALELSGAQCAVRGDRIDWDAATDGSRRADERRAARGSCALAEESVEQPYALPAWTDRRESFGEFDQVQIGEGFQWSDHVGPSVGRRPAEESGTPGTEADPDHVAAL